MSLRTSLILSGSDEGASAALKAVDGAFAATEKAAKEYAAALDRADKSAAALARAQTLATVEITSAKSALAAGKTNITQYNQALIETKSALSLVQRAHSAAVSDIGKIGPVAAVSAAQARAGYHQFGQQIQDVAVQLRGGTNIGVIVAQQGGQIADAVAMMGGRFSGLAKFLSGPWGAAVILGTSLLVDLVAGLFNTGDAADKGGSGMEKLSSSLDISKASYKTLTEVVNEYNKAQGKSTALTYEAIEAAQKSARAKLAEAESTLAQMEAAALQSNPDENLAGAAYLQLKGLRAEVDRLKGAAADADIAAATERAKQATDTDYAIKLSFDREEDKWRAKRKAGLIDEAELTKRLTSLEGARRDFTDKWQRDHRETGRQSGRTADNAQFGSPVSGYRLTGKFGENRGNHAHAGLDMAVKVGTPVYATQDGLVSFAGAAGGYGNLVKINHGAGTETRYGHLSRFAVGDNAQVQKGELIGYSGGARGAEGAGDSKGPHLHYEVRINGKAVDPTKGIFPVDTSTVADRGQQAADALANKQKRHAEQLDALSNRSAESIARITEQWDAQPKAIDGAVQSVRGLSKTMSDLEEVLVNDGSLTDAMRDSLAQMYKDAQAAKGTIVEGLLRPFEELNQQSERRLQLQTLSAQGRDAEANALQDIWAIEEKLGTQEEIRAKIAADLAAGRTDEAAALQSVLDQYPQLIQQAKDRAVHEQAVSEQLDRQRENIGQYLDATRSVKQELVSIGSGQGSLGNFNKIFKNLNSQVLVEKVFGSSFRDFDKWVQGQSGLGPSVDHLAGETDRAGSAAGKFADAINSATSQISNPGLVPGAGSLENEFDTLFGGQSANLFSKLIGATQDTTAAITVVGKKVEKSMSPDDWARKLSGSMTDSIAAALPQIFGGKVGRGVLGGALYGNLAGGGLGAIVGGLSGIPGLGGLASAIPGIGQANMLFDIAQSFGIKVPASAKYGFIPALLKSIFGKRPRGSGSVSNTGVSASANDKDIKSGLNDFGTNVQSTLAGIASQLGAALGSYSVGFGNYKGKYYQVSGNATDRGLGGSNYNKKGSSVLYDGTDPQAALAAAIKNAIEDGAIQGISAAMQKALGSSKDVQAGIEEALKVHEVELLIGGIGAQLSDQFKSFEKQAAERLRVARQYGFDVVKIEARNAEDRTKLLKDMLAQQVGSLQQLIDELTSGSLFEGSAVDQRQALLGKIAAARAEADKGTAGAADTLAQLLTQLNAVSKEAFGTTGGFAEDRSTILDAARSTIALANQRITDAQKTSDPALTTTNAALDENNAQNAQIIAELGITNAQLQQLIAGSAGNVGNLKSLALTSPLGLA